ncbi:uncharacterized protein LOC105258690 [Camponotus floridanus]|uniref:uncharacterized protein LOC105258690 n=1 Tax=Camponotus floridanus TaxID=104421 RepID=UPI000DC6B8E9|nr:uncharacterized protein LOC105258690 [Camponotus floridanus]XP_025270035.1 uncharacterized protein LOC105258690 [Camponotus floridanus]
MAAFNGVRVLPDIPNMETLIQEFETGFRSSNRQEVVSESSISGGGSFVKKIVEAYESSVKASIDNAEQEHASKRSSLFNTIRNRKNVEKSDSSPSMYSELGSNLRRWSSLKNTSEISSTVKKYDLEDDFVMPNQYHSKSCKKTDILKTWSSKINKSGLMKELMNIRPNSSKKSETEILDGRGQAFYSPPESERKYKSKNNMPLICSSPLEDVDDKNIDYIEDPLDDILTNSHDSSNASNNSYKNLQVDLYDFESEEWELSSTSSSRSLNSSSRSLHDDTSSTKSHTNGNLLLESSFEDVTVIPSKDLNDCENQVAEEILEPSSNFIRKLPQVIGVSLKRPIKIDNDTSITWLPVLGEKLPQKKSLKKLLSMFNRAKLSLNHRKKSKERQPKKQHIFDSGFIEQCPSVSSSSSQQSWYSDTGHVDNKPSTPPTFGTFGRPKYVSEHCNGRTVKSRMMLTETTHAPELANDFVSFDPNPSHRTTLLNEENCQDVESSLKNAGSSKVFCKYPLLPKHPHLIRSSVPKHPFVAWTKMDQIEEEEAIVEKMQSGEEIEQKSDVLELRCSSTLPIPVPQSTLNVSYPRISGCADSFANNNYDVPNPHKLTSALDEVVFRRQAPTYDVPRRSWLSSLTMDSSPPVYSDNLYEEIVPCMPRFATVSPKNFRFFISQEKSRAIENSFDS